METVAVVQAGDNGGWVREMSGEVKSPSHYVLSLRCLSNTPVDMSSKQSGIQVKNLDWKFKFRGCISR